MTDPLHLNILPEAQLKLLEKLSTQAFIQDFYLAGGTRLALQLGHRQSIDFDFFTPTDFETSNIIHRLTQLGDFQRGNEDANTINGSLNGVRISFFGYRYAIIDNFTYYNHIRLAGMKDIAAMKLEAIAGRGSKKDFVDLFYLLQQFTLEEIFSFHTLKYGTGLSNQYHHLKSLVYFVDAETQAMPFMLRPLTWNEVKNRIVSCAKDFQLK